MRATTRVGMVYHRLGSDFAPVGAGVGLCGVGTLASPYPLTSYPCRGNPYSRGRFTVPIAD
jgi:hypothetical protein